MHGAMVEGADGGGWWHTQERGRALQLLVEECIDSDEYEASALLQVCPAYSCVRRSAAIPAVCSLTLAALPAL